MSMNKTKKIILLSFEFIFLIYLVSAVPGNTLHVNIQTTSSGSIVTGTFNFIFNISTSSACTPVLYTNSTTLTTDSRGIISYYMDNINLNFSDQYFLCYYRNGVLQSSEKMAQVPYAFYSNNSKNLDGFKSSYYLNTSSVFAPNTTAGIQFLINSTGIYNQGNSSFNESYANTKYLNFSSHNITQFNYEEGLLHIIESWFSTAWNNLFRNFFNQNLNTTANAVFNSVNITGNYIYNGSDRFLFADLNKTGGGTGMDYTNLALINQSNTFRDDIIVQTKTAVYSNGTGFSTADIGSGGKNGITTNGSDFWMSDYQDGWVYHTNKTGGNYTDGFSAANIGAGTAYGITSIPFNAPPTDFWIVDNGDDWLYHTNGAGVNQSNGFSLSAIGSDNPYGVTTNGSDFWFTDITDTWVYHTDALGNNKSDGFSTAVYGSTNPTGIVTNGSDFWTTDSGTDYVYHIYPNGTYSNDGFSLSISKATTASRGIVLNAFIGTPTDFWVSDTTYASVYHIIHLSTNVFKVDSTANSIFISGDLNVTGNLIANNFNKEQLYTPTFTGFGTVTSYNFSWVRVGNRIKVMGIFTAGTSTATEARISLPAGLTIDVSLVPTDRICGTMGHYSAGVAYHVIHCNGTNNYVTLGYQSATTAGMTHQNGNIMMATGNTATYWFEAPIQGWNT